MSKVIRPTKGEKLLIDRLRRGETQQQAARRLGLRSSRKIYQLMECDLRENSCDAAAVDLGKLAENEKCRILRRRSGLTQQEIAGRMQVSRYWVNQMETGRVDCQALSRFWDI